MRKYLEKENNWSTEEKKNEEGKGGKYLENDDIERRKIFGEGKHFVCVEYDMVSDLMLNTVAMC